MQHPSECLCSGSKVVGISNLSHSTTKAEEALDHCEVQFSVPLPPPLSLQCEIRTIWSIPLDWCVSMSAYLNPQLCVHVPVHMYQHTVEGE